MKHWCAAAALLVSVVCPAIVAAQSEPGPYARIAVLRPHDGDTVDFEAGYIQHLEWHRQAKDTWTWYGRPRASLSAILDEHREPVLPDKVDRLVAKPTVEILNLRPTMSYRLAPGRE